MQESFETLKPNIPKIDFYFIGKCLSYLIPTRTKIDMRKKRKIKRIPVSTAVCLQYFDVEHLEKTLFWMSQNFGVNCGTISSVNCS